MRVLFIGGTGIISSGCTEVALQQGIDLYHLNRGQSDLRPTPPGVHRLRGDIRDPNSVRRALSTLTFDAIVDWVAFIPGHVEQDITLFRDHTAQYIFISSASAYQKPLLNLPITESTPLRNPFWQYSRNKIACEERLMQAYRDEDFPVTIVRPSHTYDRAYIPIHGGYTVIDRMRKGLPVIVHGDGTSLWVMTHHLDFAQGFVGLLGNPHTIGEAYQITSDELLTWNQIYTTMAEAAGTTPNLVHIPSEFINAFDAEWGASLLGDKTYSVIFDNTKLKRTVLGFQPKISFAQGAREVMDWHDAKPERQQVDAGFNQLVDRIINAYQHAWPEEAPQAAHSGNRS